MYYICTEIWEEPRLPPFFVTFPLKTGVLGAHIRKTRCASRKNWVRIQEKLGAHPGKTARRVGKITRRKVFPEVKDVNVESQKKRSKLLVFRRNSSTFLSMNAHEWAHQIGVHFGTRIARMDERLRLFVSSSLCPFFLFV